MKKLFFAAFCCLSSMAAFAGSGSITFNPLAAIPVGEYAKYATTGFGLDVDFYKNFGGGYFTIFTKLSGSQMETTNDFKLIERFALTAGPAVAVPVKKFKFILATMGGACVTVDPYNGEGYINFAYNGMIKVEYNPVKRLVICASGAFVNSTFEIPSATVTAGIGIGIRI